MARPRGTDGSLLASLPWTLGALGLSVAPHVPYLPYWITIAIFGCAAWRYLIERRRRPLPSAWFRAGLALACFLGVLFTYSSISGVGPGSALLAVMAMTLAMLLLAAQVHRFLGVTGQNVITRVVGILLAALAVQFLFDGVRTSGLL